MSISIKGAIIGAMIFATGSTTSTGAEAADHGPGRACGAIQTACLPWQAPVGHRQPAIADISKVPPLPSDLELQALDRAIDEKLTICRGC
jgi:hypothetical protein